MTGNSRNFGKPGSAPLVDPAVLSGWGVRPGDTQMTVTVQQQVYPRVSADFSFTHRSFHGFFVTDDINRNPATSYESYTLKDPTDDSLSVEALDRLEAPGAGASPDYVHTTVSAADHPAPESLYGDERQSTWDGVEFTINARMRSGISAQFGGGTGRGLVDTCDTVTSYNNVNAGRARRPAQSARVPQRRTVAAGARRIGVNGPEDRRAGERGAARSRPPTLLGGTADTAPPGRCRTP